VLAVLHVLLRSFVVLAKGTIAWYLAWCLLQD